MNKILSIVLACVISIASHAFPHTPAHLIVNNNGLVLSSKNASKQMYPASLTKLMTLYITFSALRDGTVTMDSLMTTSRRAASMPRSNIDLEHRDLVSVKEAVLALIVSSANDAAVVLAEHLDGSERAFAQRMTVTAKKLGMKNTVFTNASGWHDPLQRTTAVDMARLAIALKSHFPEHYHLFSSRNFSYKGRQYFSHNRVNVRLRGAEGLKTGFTSNAGWNIVTTAKRGRVSLIGVIMGGRSHKSRDLAMIRLMNQHFRNARVGTAHGTRA